MANMAEREQLGSRLGFLLLTAGCAIGLGNIWRFPYIVGNHGGAIFVLIYIGFLLILGFPIMVAELSLGRAAQSDYPDAFRKLGPERGNWWTVIAHPIFAGNVILLMFYCVITGWLLSYGWEFLVHGFPAERDSAVYFGGFLADWKRMLFFDLSGIVMTIAICLAGVRAGIERSMKIMLGGLFLLELLIIALILPYEGATDGLRFFLTPDPSKLAHGKLAPAVFAAMTQAFFSLSLGIGSVAICGSYIKKERSLAGESILIILLDTMAAIAAGMIIFPACFALDVQPDQGPSLIFITLTKVFQAMPNGRLLGTVFFLFTSVAALSTLVAVSENVIAFLMRSRSVSRRKATLFFGVMIFVLSLPCLFGFNLLQNIHPLGGNSNILDLEDFIVSDNLLPLGALLIVLFCTRRSGWGETAFLAEANAGKGWRLPRWIVFYIKWVLPILIVLLWAFNMYTRFC